MSQKEFFVDLHIHTNYSDGIFTPEQVVEYASRVGLSAISITDHDTVDGVQEAIDAGIALYNQVNYIREKGLTQAYFGILCKLEIKIF